MLSKWKPIKKGLSESKSEQMPLKKLMKINKNNSTLRTEQTFVSISFCNDADWMWMRTDAFVVVVLLFHFMKNYFRHLESCTFTLVTGFLTEDVDGNLLHKRCHSNIFPFLT